MKTSLKTKLKHSQIICFIMLSSMSFCHLLPVHSQEYYANGKSWIEKAEQLKPGLIENALQDWEPVNDYLTLYNSYIVNSN